MWSFGARLYHLLSTHINQYVKTWGLNLPSVLIRRSLKTGTCNKLVDVTHFGLLKSSGLDLRQSRPDWIWFLLIPKQTWPENASFFYVLCESRPGRSLQVTTCPYLSKRSTKKLQLSHSFVMWLVWMRVRPYLLGDLSIVMNSVRCYKKYSTLWLKS